MLSYKTLLMQSVEEKAWQVVLCVGKKGLSGIMSATLTTEQKD
jgi:hypothetical protein